MSCPDDVHFSMNSDDIFISYQSFENSRRKQDPRKFAQMLFRIRTKTGSESQNDVRNPDKNRPKMPLRPFRSPDIVDGWS